MDMQYIPLEQLKISSVNMRRGRKCPPLDDILPSIRARGVLVPLLVRPKEKPTNIKAAKSECSAPLENYIDLHRHAVARAMLLKHQGVALRLLAAHLIVGAPNLQAQADPQRTHKEETAASIAVSKGQKLFDKERAKIAALIDAKDDRAITSGNSDGYNLAAVFAKLLTLSGTEVMQILTFIMAECLSPDHEGVECLGAAIPIDMGAWWKPNDALFVLLRDKKTVNALLAEIGGKAVANANRDATAKTQKQIIRDIVGGKNERDAKPTWRPRWMAFPARSYGRTGAPDAGHRGLMSYVPTIKICR